MVNDIDNQVDFQAWQLPLLLLGGFRAIVDEAHTRLAERGHPHARPVHGFTLQAVGAGATATDVARRLGVSKQAVGKTLGRLESEGYLARSSDPGDARRSVFVPTARGRDLLTRSAEAFADVVDGWSEKLGEDGVRQLVSNLRRLGVDDTLTRLDLGAWSA